MSDAGGITNFNSFSHGQMRSMVEGMDSGSVMAASDPWRRASDSLKQIRTALNTASADATSSWEGTTSDAFYTKMSGLANSVNSAASYANDAAVAMQMMAEAIDAAKQDMPEEPSFLDKLGDGISDAAKSTVGVTDEDTRTTVTEEKKAQAVAVMQTLSLKYRAATQFLKPPPAGFIDEDYRDLPASDSGGASALAGLIMGGGMGFASAQGSTGASSSTRASAQSPRQTSVTSPKVSPAPKTDSGITGGTANPAPNPKAPSGSATGIDGIAGGGRAGGSAGAGGPGGTGVISGGGSGRGGSGLSGTGTFDGLPIGGSAGGSGAGRGAGGGLGSGTTGRGGSAFGSSGMGESGAAGGGRGAGGRSGSLTRRGGGVVGEAGEGGSRRGAFTEGGSGLGRGRGGSGQGAAGQGHGMPGAGQAGKKDKKKGKDRPDYLVEDEETWVSGDHVNPNVVE
ncbi:PPE domain-containing protein [Kitasatospora paranensis]|uniref:PPE domain-containing protein n=1 Tax=Kitasatospora paranensis TaxID=258053 RepID=A0ABW2FZB1_9ACTN